MEPLAILSTCTLHISLPMLSPTLNETNKTKHIQSFFPSVTKGRFIRIYILPVW